MASDSIFNTQAAAEFLSELMPNQSVSYWYQWLTNSRKTNRKQPFTIPFTAAGRVVFYEQDDLVKFAELQRQRAHNAGKLRLFGEAAEALRAFAANRPGSPVDGIYGKSWTDAEVNLRNDEHTGSRGAIVQVIIGEHRLMSALTPEQAIEFGQKLVKAGRAGQQHNAKGAAK